MVTHDNDTDSDLAFPLPRNTPIPNPLGATMMQSNEFKLIP